MKKILAIFLIHLHLLAATGVFASVHYCGHVITGFSLGIQENDENCSCSEVKKTDCCLDLVIKSETKTPATLAKSPDLTPVYISTELFFFQTVQQEQLNQVLGNISSNAFKVPGLSEICIWRI